MPGHQGAGFGMRDGTADGGLESGRILNHVVSGEHQAKLDPDNPSVLEPIENEWRLFEVLRSLGLRHPTGAAPQTASPPPGWVGTDPLRLVEVPVETTGFQSR